MSWDSWAGPNHKPGLTFQFYDLSHLFVKYSTYIHITAIGQRKTQAIGKSCCEGGEGHDPQAGPAICMHVPAQIEAHHVTERVRQLHHTSPNPTPQRPRFMTFMLALQTFQYSRTETQD
jgi:hypothetical protein